VTYDMKADRNDPTAVGTSQVADAIVAKLEKARTPGSPSSLRGGSGRGS
jgi:hypothetical protein